MVRKALAFVAGALILHRLPALPEVWPWAAVLAALCLAGWRAGLPSVCAFCCGFGWIWLHAATRLANDLPAEIEGQDLALQGCIATLPERSAAALRFGLDVTAAAPRVPRFVELTWYEPLRSLQAGDCIAATVRLRARRGFANPGGYDYEAQLLARGVGATGYVRELEPSRPSRRPWRYALVVVREWLGTRIETSVGPQPALGVIKGLAIGDRQSLTVEQWRTLAATGTSHLMAISGLHVGIVAGLAAWFGRRSVALRVMRQRCIPGQDVAAVCALLAASLYAALAGFAVPTQRALVMLAIYLLARLARRHVAPSATLACAAVAVLVIDPFAPLSPGAWLSFGAVAAILWGLSGRPVRSPRHYAFLRVQGSITMGLLPLLVVAFGLVSLVAPLANLGAIPFFSLLIVPLVLIGTLLAACSLELGSAVLGVAATLLDRSWPALEWLATSPFATLHVAEPGAAVLAALTVTALLAVAPVPWPVRTLACVGAAALLLRTPAPVPEGTLEVAVLDVGQGLAVVVRTQTHTLVYDTGPAFRSGRDTGELVVLPYLHAFGVRRIDRLILSHGDLDHVGGVEAVTSAMFVGTLIAGPSVVERDRPIERCKRGDAWHWDGVHFRFLHPVTSDKKADRDNDTSCVLEIAVGTERVLLTGDIEARAEQQIVDRALARSATVLVAPHHGSRTSSSQRFVAATRPQVVVFSAGHRNRWGFPLADVEQRWRDAGSLTLRTATSGAVLVRIDRSGITRLEEFRRVHRRYWRAS